MQLTDKRNRTEPRTLQENKRLRGNRPEGGTPLDLVAERRNSEETTGPAEAHGDDSLAADKLGIMPSFSTILTA